MTSTALVVVSQPHVPKNSGATAEIALAEQAAITQPSTPLAEDDRQAVAARIRNLLGQTNLTEKRIAIGGEYKARRNQLRRSSRHDDDRTGWYAEFAKPSPHPFSRRIAERHVDFAEAFGNVGHVWPMLPHAFRALHLLATFKLSDAQLRRKCLSGEIAPNSTEAQIWKLGAELGTVQAKPAIKKSKEPASTPVLSKRTWSHASPEQQTKFIDDIGIDALLAACSPKASNDLWGRAKRQLVMTGVPEAKLLVLPAPANSSMLHHDLVPTWDAATPGRTEEARRRARE
jgi:hypothetical protein